MCSGHSDQHDFMIASAFSKLSIAAATSSYCIALCAWRQNFCALSKSATVIPELPLEEDGSGSGTWAAGGGLCGAAG